MTQHGIDFGGFLAVFCTPCNLLTSYPHTCPVVFVPVPVTPAFAPGCWTYLTVSGYGGLRRAAAMVCCGPPAPLPVPLGARTPLSVRVHPETGDVRCPNCDEFVNVKCWQCQWVRHAPMRTADEIRGVPPEERTPDEVYRYGTHGPWPGLDA